MWIRCQGNCLQLLGFWNFFVFFRFFPLKLVYFWTKSRKNIYGCFFHSFCATDLKFGTKNIRSMKLSILKTLIFASYWDSVPSQCYRYQKTILQRLIFLQKRSLCQLYRLKRHNRNLVTASLSPSVNFIWVWLEGAVIDFYCNILYTD